MTRLQYMLLVLAMCLTGCGEKRSASSDHSIKVDSVVGTVEQEYQQRSVSPIHSIKEVSWLPSDATNVFYYNTRSWSDSGRVYLTFTAPAARIQPIIERFSGGPTFWTTNALDDTAVRTINAALMAYDVYKPNTSHPYIVGRCPEVDGRYRWLVIIDTNLNKFWYIE